LRVELRIDGDTIASTQADADGRWRLHGPALTPGVSHALHVSTDHQTLTLNDVIAGEVWLASGQSNVEWPLTMVTDGAAELALADHPDIRLHHVPRWAATDPQETARGVWMKCDPHTARQFSAVGYFFGREIHRTQGRPVGIILSAWGGSEIEAWLPGSTKSPARPAAADPALLAAYREAVVAWQQRVMPPDPGNTGEAMGWAEPEFDDSAWPTIHLPASFQSAGSFLGNGSVWFRRTVPLPEAWRGQPLTVDLGCVDDFDVTYAGGREIGRTDHSVADACEVERSYAISADCSEGERLTLAVRVFDQFGEGGFTGPAGALRLRCAADPTRTLPLHGLWRHQLEHGIGTVPGEILNDRPTPPADAASMHGPGHLFNGMIAPLAPYALRGVLWYQGESNAVRHADYEAQLGALIREWRTRWGDDDLPFFIAQLPGWGGGGNDWVHLRAAQADVAGNLPGVGLACQIDLGDRDDIHPMEKRPIAHRLARLARERVYGEHDLATQGPTLASWTGDGDAIVLRFHVTGRLRTTDGESPRGFDSGATRRDLAAVLEPDGASVRVPARSDEALRYASRAWNAVNLTDATGLPTHPFQIDPTAR
jgi:sialate O-acetylesterase